MEYFKKRLLEGSNIEAILRNEYPGVRFNVEEKDDLFSLSILVVQYKQRKKGLGNKFMKRLLVLAKEHNKNIALTPDASYSSDEDMNQKQLTKWYEKLGFKKKSLNKHSHSIINN